MTTTQEPRPTLDQIAEVIFNHVMDTYNVKMADRAMFDRPIPVKDWDGPGRDAIVWEFEILGEPWISHLGTLTIAGCWLEAYNHYAVYPIFD